MVLAPPQRRGCCCKTCFCVHVLLQERLFRDSPTFTDSWSAGSELAKQSLLDSQLLHGCLVAHMATTPPPHEVPVLYGR